MSLLKVAGLLIAGGLVASCGGTVASRPYVSGGASVTYRDNDNPFYSDLAPYGRWVEHPRYGTVFIPASREFSPYENGRWVYTDQGFTWVSDEPFGWATEHYGRWTRDDRLGWAWIPGQEWSPGRVAWYDAGDHVGWAPLDPDNRPYAQYERFVPVDNLTRGERHYVAGRDWRDRARRIDRLDQRWVQERNISLQPQRVEIRRINEQRQQRAAEEQLRQQQAAEERLRQQQAAEARQRAEEDRQRTAEARQREQEAQQRAREDAERRRQAAAGIDDSDAARVRREAQADRREEQQLRREAQQERRADQMERRGGPGANPAADERDRQRDLRDAERDQRDRERAQRDRERAQRELAAEQRTAGNDAAKVAQRFARQHADERQKLLGRLDKMSEREMRDLDRDRGSEAERQALVTRQRLRQQHELRALEEKQRAQIDAELRNLRASGGVRNY